MSKSTKTPAVIQPSAIPCPSWCTIPDHDFDFENGFGREPRRAIRHHEQTLETLERPLEGGGFLPVFRLVMRGEDTVDRDGRHYYRYGPTVTIEDVRRCHFTATDARKIAAMLLNAADYLDEVSEVAR